MTAERWQLISNTFDSALQLPVHERTAYLESACAGDAELRGEVARLISELEKAGDFLEVPVASPIASAPPALASGDLICDRYRVESLLGRGGMGEVYRVLDTLMQEPVALKILRPELAANRGVLRRFQREVQLARKISHPNVCRVYEVGLHRAPAGTLHFFTMQLITGETLAQRIHRSGALSKEEAYPLIRQIAAGLGAAHVAGIIHRDFKSSNVMLDGPTPVITDFGLARYEEAATTSNGAAHTRGTLTLNRQVAGTVAYMSPEQFLGGNVTTASDLYSFGIVMFEMATGRMPFEDSHIIKSAVERQTSLDVRSLAPTVEPQWTAAIARCLQYDPAQRFRSAEALAEHFRDGWRPPMVYWTRRQWAKAALVTTGIALLSLALFIGIPRLRYRALEAGARIMLIPTVNTTGDNRLDALTTMLRASVSQSAKFNLWDPQRLNTVLRGMRREPGAQAKADLPAKDWREIAFRDGSPFIVFSTLSRIGDGYSLTLHAEQIGAAPDPPMRTWDQTLSVSSPNALFDAVHGAASWIRTTAGETATQLSAHNRLPQDITSSSWEALQLYEQAQQFSSAGKPDQAVPFLRRAVDRDPHFAMAWMRLGDILVSQRNGQEGFPVWRRAIEEGRAQHLTEQERLNLESRYALEIGDYAKAEPIFREWMASYPQDIRPREWMTPTLRYLGRYSDSVDFGRSTNRSFGPTVFTTGHIIHSLGLAGRLDEIPKEIESLEKIGANMMALRFRGLLAAARRDYATAEKLFLEYAANVSGVEASHAISFQAHLAADQGDFDKASKLLQRGLEQDRQTGRTGLAASKASGIAFLALTSGNAAQARSSALQTLSILSSPEMVTRSVSILARLGRVAEAKRVLSGNAPGEGPTYEGLVARAQAEILMAEGRGAAALKRLANSDRTGDASQQQRWAQAFSTAGDDASSHERYLAIASSPWICWANPEKDWPGICQLSRNQVAKNSVHK